MCGKPFPAPLAGELMTASIITRNLCVSFDEKQILKNIDFIAANTGITAIVGRSGSGKTTLLRQFNRLNEIFPGYRASGSAQVRLDGRLVETIGNLPLPLSQLRRRIGMVFQTPDVLPTSIRRNMILPLKVVAGKSGKESDELMERALTHASLWQEVCARLDSPASSLSGGQKQRLCLARALALAPDILLLDEPTASLDIMATEVIENLLADIARDLPLVIVTHNPAQAERLADRAAIMVQGQMLCQYDKGDFDAQMLMEMLQGAEVG